MKLLFHSPQFFPSMGGLQNVVQWWAEELTGMGHDVVVTTYTTGPDPHGAAYAVVRNPSMGQLYRAMRRADIVIMVNTTLRQLLPWWLSRRPLFISHHTAMAYEGQPMTWQARTKIWVANHLASGQAACSAYVAGFFRPCAVLPNPCRLPAAGPALSQRPAGSMLFAGRLVADKGLHHLLEALSLLQSSHGQQPWQLTILGDGPEGPALQQAVAQAGLSHRVKFAGSQPASAVHKAMQQHQLLLVPSTMEPFGLVVLEGLAAGCQVLASQQGGLPEAGGPWATYLPPANPATWHQALAHWLNSPPANIPAADLLARAHYLHRHQPRQAAQALHGLLQAALGKAH